MGLIKAAMSAGSGVLGDQWKEYFTCDALPNDVLVRKATKKTTARSSNTNGEDNIITNGSVVAVAVGQCMLITDQGKIVEVCAEPGEFIYNNSTEPSIFTGNLGDGILDSFKNLGKRFTFGGQPAKDQRVYYVNTLEIKGNKYGTASPIPFKVVQKDIGLNTYVNIKCFGEYSYHITDPVRFFSNVAGNVAGDYTRDKIDSQLKSELLTALQPAFTRVADMGIEYASLPGYTKEIATKLNEELSSEWADRGIEIFKFGVSSVTANKEDEDRIKEIQTQAVYRDPTMGAAITVKSRAEAMKAAAENPNGAMMGFMGMGMAGNAVAGTEQQLYQMGATQQQAPAASKPAADSWTCSCGATNTGKFCSQCGSPKPVVESWTCTCGTTNTGKFCQECGKPKPVKQACPTCGWQGEEGKNVKFCPECGYKF
ncbi:MAG: SPFH domain-containing protein [Holdemanella sp.]|nr:SPFH domain-containing protein [Holdemanella sp.]